MHTSQTVVSRYVILCTWVWKQIAGGARHYFFSLHPSVLFLFGHLFFRPLHFGSNYSLQASQTSSPGSKECTQWHLGCRKRPPGPIKWPGTNPDHMDASSMKLLFFKADATSLVWVFPSSCRRRASENGNMRISLFWKKALVLLIKCTWLLTEFLSESSQQLWAHAWKNVHGLVHMTVTLLKKMWGVWWKGLHGVGTKAHQPAGFSLLFLFFSCRRLAVWNKVVTRGFHTV